MKSSVVVIFGVLSGVAVGPSAWAVMVHYYDEQGRIHWVNTDHMKVPAKYRSQVQSQLEASKLPFDQSSSDEASQPAAPPSFKDQSREREEGSPYGSYETQILLNEGKAPRKTVLLVVDPAMTAVNSRIVLQLRKTGLSLRIFRSEAPDGRRVAADYGAEGIVPLMVFPSGVVLKGYNQKEFDRVIAGYVERRLHPDRFSPP